MGDLAARAVAESEVGRLPVAVLLLENLLAELSLWTCCRWKAGGGIVAGEIAF